mmetsp:Transcript_57650/g.93299  ORF Transcript_57650/g.93299 Transcript_57650/m.93299 type:complete len:235 (-) Transcript_57650:51-755(-)
MRLLRLFTSTLLIAPAPSLRSLPSALAAAARGCLSLARSLSLPLSLRGSLSLSQSLSSSRSPSALMRRDFAAALPSKPVEATGLSMRIPVFCSSSSAALPVTSAATSSSPSSSLPRFLRRSSSSGSGSGSGSSSSSRPLLVMADCITALGAARSRSTTLSRFGVGSQGCGAFGLSAPPRPSLSIASPRCAGAPCARLESPPPRRSSPRRSPPANGRPSIRGRPAPASPRMPSRS